MATLTVEKEESVLRGYVPLGKIQVRYFINLALQPLHSGTQWLSGTVLNRRQEGLSITGVTVLCP